MNKRSEVSRNGKKSHQNTEIPEHELEEEDIVDVIKDELNITEIPEESQKKIYARVTQIVTKSMYSGPLPLPEQLVRYNKIIPNGAERIMRIAEKDQEHRIKMETKMVNGTIWTTRLGQIFGLAIGMTVIVLGFICIMKEHDVSGTLLSGLGVTGLVSVFVIGRRKKDEEQ